MRSSERAQLGMKTVIAESALKSSSQTALTALITLPIEIRFDWLEMVSLAKQSEKKTTTRETK